MTTWLNTLDIRLLWLLIHKKVNRSLKYLRHIKEPDRNDSETQPYNSLIHLNDKKINMKNRIVVILISFCISFSSCEQGEKYNFFCVNTVLSSPSKVILSRSEIRTIKYLFYHNDLNYNHYQFYRLTNDELGHSHVRCNQFVNGLRVFTDDLIFHFDQNDNYYFLSGDIINKIELNTYSSMDNYDVAVKFLTLVENDNSFIGDKSEIINGCFDLEFGYFDLNAGISYTEENFTKAWKIKPADRDYPYAYINDENTEIISYDNGIRY